MRKARIFPALTSHRGVGSAKRLYPLSKRVPINSLCQVTPAQPDRLVSLVVTIAHRLDHMAGRIAAAGAGGSVGNRH